MFEIFNKICTTNKFFAIEVTIFKLYLKMIAMNVSLTVKRFLTFGNI